MLPLPKDLPAGGNGCQTQDLLYTADRQRGSDLTWQLLIDMYWSLLCCCCSGCVCCSSLDLVLQIASEV